MVLIKRFKPWFCSTFFKNKNHVIFINYFHYCFILYWNLLFYVIFILEYVKYKFPNNSFVTDTFSEVSGQKLSISFFEK